MTTFYVLLQFVGTLQLTHCANSNLTTDCVPIHQSVECVGKLVACVQVCLIECYQAWNNWAILKNVWNLTPRHAVFLKQVFSASAVFSRCLLISYKQFDKVCRRSVAVLKRYDNTAYYLFRCLKNSKLFNLEYYAWLLAHWEIVVGSVKNSCVALGIIFSLIQSYSQSFNQSAFCFYFSLQEYMVWPMVPRLLQPRIVF